jgi:hypothetical protein
MTTIVDKVKVVVVRRDSPDIKTDLDDRFHESCHKRGIHLGFRTPI